MELCLVPGEVPSDNGSGNDEILTSDDELSDEDEGCEVEEVSWRTYGVLIIGE